MPTTYDPVHKFEPVDLGALHIVVTEVTLMWEGGPSSSHVNGKPLDRPSEYFVRYELRLGDHVIAEREIEELEVTHARNDRNSALLDEVMLAARAHLSVEMNKAIDAASRLSRSFT